MPKHLASRGGRGRGRGRGRRRGGKVKASDVLSGLSATALGASTLGVTAPFLLPIAGLTGIASGIARLFGAGGLTQEQANILMRAQRQGFVVSKRPTARKRPVRKRKPKR